MMKNKVSIAPDKLMLAHFSRDELNMFDEMQGGPDIRAIGDNQLRSYEGLLPIFARPETREFFEVLASKIKEKRKAKKPKLLDKFNKLEEEKNIPVPDHLGPDGEEIAAMGQGGDDDIALMPVAILDYFDAIIGKPQVNKITGLPQYKKLWEGIINEKGEAINPHAPVAPEVSKAFFEDNPNHPLAGFYKRFLDLQQANPGKSARDVFKHHILLPAMFPKTSSNPLVNFRNDVLKPIAKNPIGRTAVQLGIAIATGGMSLPVQLAAQAGAAGLMSRTAGNKWNNVLKDAAVAGITHGAGALGAAKGLGLGTQAIAKGATHYGASKALGRDANLLASALTGAGHYGLGGGFGNLGGLGAGVSAGSEAAGTAASTGAGFGISPHIGALSASQLPAAALSTTAPSLAGGSLFSTLTSPIASLAGNLGLTPMQALGLGGAGFMLHKGYQQQKNLANKAKREAEEKHRAANQEIQNAMHDYSGFDVPLAENLEYPDTVITPSGERESLVRNPRSPSPADVMFGREHRWYIPRSEADQYRSESGYKKGGIVKHAQTHGIPNEIQFITGPGGGQDDKIPFDYLRNGDFIWDASSTSNLGDGSPNEGYRKITELLTVIRNKKGHVPTESHNQMIPAALSDSEVKIPAEDVDRIGNGSNRRGALILNKIREDLRADKIKNGKKLPHKAKNIFTYYKAAGGSL